MADRELLLDYSKDEDEETPSECGDVRQNHSDANDDLCAPLDSILSKQNLLCIFVATFDTHFGNIIEWCHPKEMSDVLAGVEFKALPSGCHQIDADFVYLRSRAGHFGLAHCAKLELDSDVERGARIKSVGILSRHYAFLPLHYNFLRVQTAALLSHPGDYSALTSFLDENRCVEADNLSEHNIQLPGHFSLLASKFSHASSDSQCDVFLEEFGEVILVLWKFVVLRKRVLFFSTPPIGKSCLSVHFSSLLASHNLAQLSDWSAEPFFFVSIADLDVLVQESHFVACTTENIFQHKPVAWDLFVSGRKLESPCFGKIAKVTNGDRMRWRELQKELAQSPDQKAALRSFFLNLNNRMFSALFELSTSGDPCLTTERVRELGFDPKSDKDFFVALIEQQKIDLTLIIDDSCCTVL